MGQGTWLLKWQLRQGLTLVWVFGQCLRPTQGSSLGQPGPQMAVWLGGLCVEGVGVISQCCGGSAVWSISQEECTCGGGASAEPPGDRLCV